ncbi:unnamed protein product [Euphydryas editha]|uniref:RNA-directed DNA polymerase n=1 Tax=Euphydryas editha TaxID=104508 RepID=A0AAU9V9A2_EUPED|nr:unnamed protein product [Euphydryas editha]
MKWVEFKEIFLSRFDMLETCAATILKMLTGKPQEGECLATYASRIFTILMSRWGNLGKEEMVVSLILAHMGQIEPRLQRSIFSEEITSRCKMQRELMAFSYHKRSYQETTKTNASTTQDNKRPRLSSVSTKCYACGKIGHKSFECFSRSHDKQQTTPTSGRSNTAVATRASLICYKCGVEGHVASRCSKTWPVASSSAQPADTPSVVKRVDVCGMKPVTGIITQFGEQFSFCFDSGADCSLIKESVSRRLVGTLQHTIVTLTGVGKSSVLCDSQILSSVALSGHDVQILFHIIPDDYLNNDILIGRDLLALELSVHISSDKLTIVEKPSLVNICNVGNAVADFQNVDTDMPDDLKPRLIELLSCFKESFVEGTPTSRVKTGELEINLIDPSKIVQRRPYHLSPEERMIVRNKCSELLSAGVIRSSKSPFSSPILLVKKRDGTDRMCVDYRELNSNTVPDRYPLPLIGDQVQRLSGARFYTCLDMASGFYQVPINVESNSIEKTAFITPDAHYEFTAMPFGLRNAPSVYQRAINTALGDLAHSYVIVYMDDLVIPANNVEQGLERLRVVLKTLSDAGFSFNIKKCAFLKKKVQFLGYEISEGEIRPNPRKIIALTSSPPPQTITQLRQFLGLASYFRQVRNNKTRYNIVIDFIPGFDAFRPSSSEGYGAILFQRAGTKLHPVEYYSKRTTHTESRYHSYELETLAVVNSVKHFRHYLYGRTFTVVTDCNSLKASRTKVDLTPRVHRWWAFLQAFDFDIQYREGRRIAHVDFFSRNHLPQVNNTAVSDTPSLGRENYVVEKRINLAELSSNWLQAEQRRDPEYNEIITKLESDDLDVESCRIYELRSNVLYRRIQRNNRNIWLPIVPRAFRWSIINHIHESVLHLGWDKTLEKAYQYYWFPNMSKYVRKFVENCITCRVAKSRSGKQQIELHPIPKANIPWHTIHIDATGKLSGKNDQKEYVFVLVDAFTKYVLLRHSTRINTDSVISALKASISLFGTPVATGSCRANGQVERIMSTLKNMLTVIETSPNRSWQDALDDVQLSINSTIHRVTKASPLELLIGRVARPLNLLTVDDHEVEVDVEEIRDQANRLLKNNACLDKARFDQSRAKLSSFSVGDYVLIENHERNQTKLDSKYKGPYEVIEVLDGDRYHLKSLNCNRVYKYARDRLRPLPQSYVPTELDPCLSDDNDGKIFVQNFFCSK